MDFRGEVLRHGEGGLVSELAEMCCSDTETGVAVSGHVKNGYSDTEMGVAVSGHCEKGKSDTGRSVLVSMVPFK